MTSNDNDDATRWEVRRTDERTVYVHEGRWVGGAQLCTEVNGRVSWSGDVHSPDGRLLTVFRPDRDEAEAWVCAQTGHPGTTTPATELGDCEGEGVPATPCPDCDDTGECPDCTAQGQSFLGCDRCDDTGRCHCWDGK